MNLFRIKRTEEVETNKKFWKLLLEPEAEFYIKKKDAMQWLKNYLMIDVKETSEMLKMEGKINFQEIRAKKEGLIFPIYVSQKNTLEKVGQAFFMSKEELLDVEEAVPEEWKKMMRSTMEKFGDLEAAFHFWENYQQELLKAQSKISIPVKYLCSFGGLVYFIQEFYNQRIPNRPIPTKADIQKWLIGQGAFGTVRNELMIMKNQELKFDIETILQRYLAEDKKIYSDESGSLRKNE